MDSVVIGRLSRFEHFKRSAEVVREARVKPLIGLVRRFAFPAGFVLPKARSVPLGTVVGDHSGLDIHRGQNEDLGGLELDVLGTHNAKLPPHDAEWTQSRQVALFYTYLVRGQMSMADLITHHFWPEQATEVYPMLQENRRAPLGVIFDWRQDRHPAGP